ncbi:putative membrane protein YphA (DoxX/SURF4 family) [Actinoplanes lutulentus]|uniref:DoxX-like protein n=1 Tax=Actinoplanes lutulentus TaxID=1287878 RepID=A0A327Z8Q7_9ACTN|nr:DoxX family protein [Actinoplanes lutulentus]MBB2948430.1 putative membrane protein YphA (DoxX/SURF4 family) [Actinoplanes lutulentus]RAK34537.1 DoxX-like protein [Actinoplanes lutulentus]
MLYWILAGLLAVFYLYAGGKKVTQSKDQLAPMMGWVDTVPMPAVRLIGALEILGALGLILPPLTGIAAWLAVAAAIGLAIVQIGGIAVHVSRGETKVIGLNIALLALAVVLIFIAP